jgi:glycosyltransferase involved in cell wall biosynthesis
MSGERLKILHVTHSDGSGGAARASYRTHRALLEAGVESRMRVRHKLSDDWTVGGPSSAAAKGVAGLRAILGAVVNRLQSTSNANPHSANLLPSNWSSAINRSNADVVHLHWMAAETMSIEDTGRITKPLIMTLHDMWAFCGAEHYAPDGPDARWRRGYDATNRPIGHRRADLDCWTWRRKRRAWRRAVHVLCPSRWLADCARASALMRDWSIGAVPNVLDTATFRPLDRGLCRTSLNLPVEHRVVLFGALGGGSDPRKGYDLLLEGLWHWRSRARVDNVLCVVFGQTQPRDPPELPLPTRWIGPLHDDVALALLYGAADVMVVPSRQENLVQTGTEAQSCGCPVVAFAATGMPDVVEHGSTGYLAAPYDTQDLARGIVWTLEDEGRRVNLGHAARQRALQLWSPETLVPRYLEAYETAISLQRCDGTLVDDAMRPGRSGPFLR